MSENKKLRKDLGQRIRQLRKAKGWTQQELAERADLDWKYFGAIERGERNPTLDNIGKVAQGLGVDVHHLFLVSTSLESMAEELTESKIQDLLEHSDEAKKKLMWKLLSEVAVWERE